MATFDDTTVGTSSGGTTPTYGLTKSSAPNIRTTVFGDGFEQRTTFGLNQNPKVFNLTFEKSESDADAIEAFLDARAKVAESFTFTPPGEGTTKTGTYSQSGTTVTITISAGHGLEVGDQVTIDYTSGSAVDGIFTVKTKTSSTIFVVTAAASATNSGNVSVIRSNQFMCETWSKSIPYNNRATIQATFRQVFEP